MQLEQITLNCQNHNPNYIDRKYSIVKVTISQADSEYKMILDEAIKLAQNTHSQAANSSTPNRDTNRKKADAFIGLLAEYAWRSYFNQELGKDSAKPVACTDVKTQIDLKLFDKLTVEVRSSFAKNGYAFALCSDKYNFKNIGPYTNTIKESEPQKDLYCGVLFEGNEKEKLLDQQTITFYLAGSSTWEMMLEKGKDVDLTVGSGSDIDKAGNYRVVFYKDSMDVKELITYLEEKRKHI